MHGRGIRNYWHLFCGVKTECAFEYSLRSCGGELRWCRRQYEAASKLCFPDHFSLAGESSAACGGLASASHIGRFPTPRLSKETDLTPQISDQVMDMPTGTGANQIVERGNSSHNPGMSYYVDLVEAVKRGDWNATRDFLNSHTDALRARITVKGGTVLHVAVDAEQEHIVEELLEMISEEDMVISNIDGDTALDVSIDRGNCQIADRLIRKNKSLVHFKSTAGWTNQLPVVRAMRKGHKQLARMLYRLTPLEELEAEHGEQGAKLCSYAIEARDVDFALDLIERCPSSALVSDSNQLFEYERTACPWRSLAVVMTNSAFTWRNRLVRWIYDHCVHVSYARATDQIRLDINQNNQETSIGSGARATDQMCLDINQNGQETSIGSGQALLRKAVSSLLNLFGLKDLYEATLVDVQVEELLSRMCKVIRTSNISSESTIADAIFIAISRGNFVFVYEILKANSGLLLIRDSGGSMLHRAIKYRQHRIFSLIYGLTEKDSAILRCLDCEGKNILHKAGELTKYTPIDHITGSVFQMQREVQWFKEVESICPPMIKEQECGDHLTPRELFTESHRELRKEGEKWMKDTATSCTVVGALIVTIMFAAAFTIPGGSNQNTGLPILVHDKLFKIFIVTDSLSLFSSSSSVLMFLGILTSRYADDDFLKSLPTKMIIGLFALFFSITTMMIAFSAALLLMLHEQYWTVAPIIGMAGIPIILFVLMQFRLLFDMLVSTYGPSIFDRKIKL